MNELNKLREAPKYRVDRITDLPEQRNKLGKDYKNKTAELQSKLDQANDEIDELKAEITKLKNKLEERKKRNAQLEQRCLDKHALSEKLRGFEGKLAAAKAITANLEKRGGHLKARRGKFAERAGRGKKTGGGVVDWTTGGREGGQDRVAEGTAEKPR